MLFITNIFFTVASVQTKDDKKLNEFVVDERKNPNDDSFDLKVKLLMRLSHIPSFTCGVIKNNSIVWSNAYGYLDIYKRKKATIDTIYNVASITKTFSATAILQLYEQGLFDLDDNVSEYLPFDLKNPKYPDVNITFRMLLSHHSSFCCRTLESLLQPLEPEFDITLSNVIKGYLLNWVHLKDLYSGFYHNDLYPWVQEIMVPNGSLYYDELWGDYPPGERYYYSNTIYSLLGYLVERLTNQSFEDYCKEHFFIPLSMHNTSFYLDDLNKDQLAVPYLWLHRIYLPLPFFEYYCQNPAAGLRTNLEDLSHWLIAHMNGGIYNGVRILNESTIEDMHTVQYPHIEPGTWGLGWEIFEVYDGVVQGHSGSNLGYASGMFYFSPDISLEKHGFIWFWNEEMWSFSLIGLLPQYKDYRLHDELIFALLDWALEF